MQLLDFYHLIQLPQGPYVVNKLMSGGKDIPELK